MLDDLAEGLFRLLGRLFVEVVVELLIKGPGYLIVRAFSKGSVDPDGWKAVIVGLLFWLLVGFAVYFVFFKPTPDG
ncbi:MAG: hypothetical protein AAFN78_01810 [Pseudomonadota bacterium]